MKKVTSMTILTTAEGKRISITFSEIDDKGNIIKENQRINKVVIDNDALNHISALDNFSQGIVESE